MIYFLTTIRFFARFSHFVYTVYIHKKNIRPQNEILDKLGIIPVSESVLANLVKKSVPEIKADLVVLELQGLIRKQDGGYVLN